MRLNIQQICCEDLYHSVKNGHLDCLTYLVENGSIVYDELLDFSAEYGHFECLKYLHSKGCQLSSWASAYAAENGDLDCLKYLIANDCPLYEIAIFNASANGHLDCLKYLITNGCPNPRNSIKGSIYYMVSRFHIQCLKYYINESLIENVDDLFITLDKYPTIVDLHDKWWRNLLFNKDLSKYNTLNNLVTKEKTEISNKIQFCEEHLSYKLVPNDVVKHILSSYF